MEPHGSQTSRRTHASPGGGREDCWSEGATETLIEAWGDRYVKLNRGNLRQKDWKEVADSVNVRQDGVKQKKTDIQCKNRIDTLKKKYKIEKAKPPPSKWPFYYRLDSLIGTDATKKPTTTLTLKVKPRPNAYTLGRSKSTEKDLSSNGDNEEEEYDDDDDDVMVVKKVHRMEDVDLSDASACRELARAILRFGEIYEKIESEKQKQMMELEKERMKFIKDIECERMNMFMVSQSEIKKLKRQNRPATSSGKKSHG